VFEFFDVGVLKFEGQFEENDFGVLAVDFDGFITGPFSEDVLVNFLIVASAAAVTFYELHFNVGDKRGCIGAKLELSVECFDFIGVNLERF